MYVSQNSTQTALQRAAALLDDGPVLDFQAGYSRALDDQRYRLNSDSRQRAIAEAYDGYIDHIHQTTGQRLRNPIKWDADSRAAAEGALATGQSFEDWTAARWSKFDAQVDELAAKHPGLAVKRRPDLMAEIAAKAKDLKAKAEAPDATRVGWSGTGEFLGRAQGAMEDPLNAVSLLFGAGGGRAVAAAGATLAQRFAVGATNVARVGAQEGAINAATEAAVQGQVASFNRELGIDYGAREMATNIGFAFAGGAVLGGGAEGLAQAVKGVPTGDVRAAEKVMAVEKERLAANPFPPGPAGEAVFADGMNASLRAVVAGRPVDMAPLRQAMGDVVMPPPPEGVRFDVAAIRPGAVLPASDVAVYVHGYLRPRNWTAAEGEVPRFLFDLAPVPDGLAREAGAINTAFAATAGQPLRVSNEVVDKLYRRFVNHPATAHQVLADLPDLVDGVPLRDAGQGRVRAERLVDAADGKRQVAVFEVARHGNGIEIVSIGFRDPPRGPNGNGGAPKTPPRVPGGEPQPPHSAQAGGTGPGGSGFSTIARGENVAPMPPKSKQAPLGPLPPELKPPPRPEGMVDWLKRQGGLRDDDGWLAHMGVDNKARPGLISGRGLQLDDAALRAWEDGFFPEFHDRPSPDQLRLAVADALGPEGLDRVRGSDEGARLEREAYDGFMKDLDRLGVDPYGKSWDDIEAAVKIARSAEAAENDLWKETFARFDPDAAKALDEDAARIAQARGALMDDDVMVPTGMTDPDGRAATVSARDAMDMFDNEADAWDGAAFCLGRVA